MFGRIFDFLFNLKHVHLGPNTRLSFGFNHPIIITLAVLAIMALGYFSYMPQSASRAKKHVLGALRAVLLALVLIIACQPQLVMENDVRQPAVVAVWVDSSSSMTLEDPYSDSVSGSMKDYLNKVTTQIKAAAPGGTLPPGQARINRYQLAVGTLKDAHWLKDITQSQQILFFTGSGRAEPVGLATSPAEVDQRLAQIAAMKPDGSGTDVPTVVRDILDRVQGQRLSAMVLLTDGQTTEPGSRSDMAADKARLAGVNVYALALGQAEEPFDLQIANMRLPINTFTRDPVSARMRITGSGLTGPTPVKINIFRKKADGSLDVAPVASKELTLDPTKPQIDTDVPIRLQKTDPGKSERFDLVAKLEPTGPVPEERTLENNQRLRTVTVLDAQINVLYVEGYPRWEYRYLKNELIREPTVNLATLLLTADPGFVQDADPEVKDKVTGEELFPGPLTHFPDTPTDMNRFDVLIIGDVEPTYFSPLQQQLIIDWVKTRGGGLCFVSGSNFNPETYRETPMEVLLPVAPDEIDPRARIMPASDNQPFTLTVTPAGKETNVFRFFDDPELSWSEVNNLPALYWYKPVQGLKPGSIVLATKQARTGQPLPMLVMRQYGAGPVVFSAFGDSWRWRRYTGEPLFQSYWLQMCRLLYANKALGQSKRIELSAEATQVEIGGQIKVSLTVKDPTLNGQVPPDVAVLVVDGQGRTVQTIPLTRAPGAADDKAILEKLTGAAPAPELGEFTLQIKPGVLPVEVTPVDLAVQQPQREFQEVTMNRTGLEAITSKREGDAALRGDVLFPVQQEDLASKIPDRSLLVTHEDRESIWNQPIALILVLALATAEWLVRKSAGLI